VVGDAEQPHRPASARRADEPEQAERQDGANFACRAGDPASSRRPAVA